jgi:hypothetical protein
MDPMDYWRIKRFFEWGIVLLLDRDSVDVPELSRSPVSQSPQGLVVEVHHAQDVDLDGFADDDDVPSAEVQIAIWLDHEPPGPGTFSGVIEVPSGVLTVGDADHQDALAIGAGRWSAQIDCEPPVHSDRVTVWLRRA